MSPLRTSARWILAGICGFVVAHAHGQPRGRELLPNGGFEDGTKGWRVAIGPYGQAGGGWQAGKGVAEVVSEGAYAGQHCLRLNAVDQTGEIDVYSEPVKVRPRTAYWLSSQVRQLRGEGSYKVVIDWHDAAGKHIRYDNDWRGTNRPKTYHFHGGLFLSPDDAAEAVVILGVGKGVEALFDDVGLSELELPKEALAPAPDGEGEATWEGPRQVAAGSYATFRLRFTVGKSGLPPGARIGWRRSDVDPRWSPPQTANPKAEGYTTIRVPEGATIRLEPGNPEQVPCINWLTIDYPRLKAGDVVEVVYGDTGGGGPGVQVQPAPETDIRFLFSTDGNRDGRALDLPDSPALAVVPGNPESLAVVGPSVVSAGDRARVIVQARDKEGNPTPRFAGTVHLTWPRGSEDLRLDASMGGSTEAGVEFAEPGTASVEAKAGPMGAKAEVLVLPRLPAFVAAPTKAVARRDGEWFVLENKHLALCVPVGARGASAGFVLDRDGARTERVGSVTFGELRVQADGRAQRLPVTVQQGAPRQTDAGAGLTLKGAVRAAGADCDVVADWQLADGAKHAAYSLSVTPRGPLPLTALYGAELRVGDGSFGRSKRTALFPGLEYLIGDEVSSGTYGVIPPYNVRWAPHPYKITVPLMAVAGEHVTAGLFWSPAQKWDGEHPYPTAWFASPNRTEDRDNHLLALFGPSILNGLEENAPELAKPRVIPAGETLRLACSVFALPGADDVTAAIDYWASTGGLPALPPKPRSYDETQAMIARGLSGPAWDDKETGWHNALPDPWGAAYNGPVAFSLWQFGEQHPESPLAPRITEILSACERKYGELGGFEFSFVRGDAINAVCGSMGGAEGSIASQSADGSWGYHAHKGNQTFDQAHARVIGHEGEVVIGTCLMAMEPIVNAARLTGDPSAVKALLKGIDFIARYRRPQGAENWEVPLACPNLRAAALAVDAYVVAYQLTGKREYLDRAIFWAKTGMPFIYQWKAADRDLMPYASISVMGTSYYTGTWFGRPVQWVGLAYAGSLLRLAEYDPNPWWRHLGEGILIAAMQMQETPGKLRQHWGFFPDGWDIVKGDEAYVWDLSPQGVESVLRQVTGDRASPTTAIVRSGENTVHVTAPAQVADAALAGGALKFTLSSRLPAPYQCVVVGVSSPTSVRIDGRAATPTTDATVQPGRWRYVEAQCALAVGIAPSEGPVHVTIEGVQPQHPRPVPLTTQTQNGGFEDGVWAWSGAPSDRVRVVPQGRTGGNALLLDALGVPNETQAYSAPMLVQEGALYDLVSYVKCLQGTGGYKVTIDWLGDAGHIAYANDWKGSVPPADWTQHGGQFRAPEGAKRAVLILGCRGGTEYLFDDVSLTEVGGG